MCGIAGYQGIGDDEEGARALLERMRDSLRHRGPDDDGVYYHAGTRTALAHTRLAILDLSPLGHQPMVSDDGRVALVFNGEIYNFRELRRELEKDGVVFRGHSDTEVILALYLHQGEACLARLNGIFALAVFDDRDGLLRIARDGLGVKPLYYTALDAGKGIIFASEIKTILQAPQVSRELFIPAIQAALTQLWIPGPWSPFRAIRKVEPGHCLVIREGAVEREFSFYQLPYDQDLRPLSVADAVQEVRAHLQQAVHRQMVSDVPVGAFLSGGLDSSAVVAMAARSAGANNVRCFTIDCGGGVDADTPDDLPYARHAARALGVKLEVLSARPDMMHELPKMLWHLDEPQADPAPLNVLAIAAHARNQGYKVLLSGAGGDDIFSGYRRHTALRAERFWSWLPLAARQQLQVRTASLAGSPRGRRLAKLFANAAMAPQERLLAYFAWMPESDTAGLLSPEARALALAQCSGVAEHVSPLAPMAAALAALPAEMPALNKMLYLESRYFLVDHNLNYTDKMSMAVGVETRVPLLDPDLVALAARLPVGLKHRGVEGKWIFKKAMEGILPPEIIWRKKSGFGVPLRRWLHQDLRTLVDELLSPSSLRSRGLFDADTVTQLLARDRRGQVDATYTLFSLVCVEIWCRQFVDPELPTPAA